jgi:hypothetical protein
MFSWKGTVVTHTLEFSLCSSYLLSVLLTLSGKHVSLDDDETCPYSSELQALGDSTLDLPEAVERFYHILRIMRLLLNFQVSPEMIFFIPSIF